MTKNKIYNIVKDRGAYWLEEDEVAITGDLQDEIAIEDMNLFVNAINTLHEILEELPENPKLPLVVKIKELVEKGLKR